MGVRENRVETYLDDEINKLGGITRKWTCPQHDGVPDRICIINRYVYFVEVKTVEGELNSNQKREQLRLKNVGANVWTVFGKEGVDEFIKRVKEEVR